MDCKCKSWKDKCIKLNCRNCGGIVEYSKQTISLEKLKKDKLLSVLKEQLAEKQIEISCLRLEIRELENEIISEDGDDEIAIAVKTYLAS